MQESEDIGTRWFVVLVRDRFGTLRWGGGGTVWLKALADHFPAESAGPTVILTRPLFGLKLRYRSTFLSSLHA